jgi:N-methylhydantoinase A/oxoprolinase/acetone carboxylase beta subunit
MHAAADTGGTFTDVVADDGRVVKVPSTPPDPGAAVRQGVTALTGAGGTPPRLLAHGTTIATNALLQRRGARVALVTTEGFADIIEIARQDRPSLYDIYADRPEPLVPRELRFEVRGRIGADGAEVTPLDLSTMPDVPAGVEAAAVCLLHSDLEPAHERAVAVALRARGLDVTASSEVSPEFREYERTVTTVVNAYLRPLCRSYVEGLDGIADLVMVMTSAGGLLGLSDAADQPVRLLLSGPAGGALAGAAVAAANGWPDAVTFDMGGTSTDVCLVLGGVPAPAQERSVAGLPVRMPSLDIHTIGAGGGSVAVLDAGGALVVGPRSAGAVPGPVCYGLGGVEPTVTDADLVLGRIPAGVAFPGLGVLDDAAAGRAIEAAGISADGVVAVVDANMEQALRTVSVERGVDPRGLALVAFGGAGPLHACALADALGMPVVIVPARAGALSAVGLLCAPPQRDLVRSWSGPLDEVALQRARAELATAAEALGAGQGRPAFIETFLDCRYAGQSHELTVPDLDAFHSEHRRRNGYDRPHWPVEVTAIRARARWPARLDVVDLPVPRRDPADGPRVIAEPDCTIWVPPGWRASPGEVGALILERTA